MTRPKWTEAWQDAFDEGFEEEPTAQVDTEKRAVALRRNEDGTTEIVKVAKGAEALKLIAEAEAQGLSVETDRDQVEQLMAEQNGATDVPPEVYQLMSAVIDFARELSSEYATRHQELLDDEEGLSLGTEIEYTMDDVES